MLPVLSILILPKDDVNAVRGPELKLPVYSPPPKVLTYKPFILLPDPIILLSVGKPNEAIRAFNPLSVPLVFSR